MLNKFLFTFSIFFAFYWLIGQGSVRKKEPISLTYHETLNRVYDGEFDYATVPGVTTRVEEENLNLSGHIGSRLIQNISREDQQVEDRNSLTVSYIGNMGVLIASKNHSIVIDAFHKKYKPEYANPSETTVQEIINGRYKHFKKVDVALITHYHRDHFDAAYCQDFLQENPKSLIVASQQVIDSIRDKSRFELESNLKQVPYGEVAYSIKHKNVNIRAFKCPHTYSARHAAVQNLAFLVGMDNYTILHIGDTDWELAESVFKKEKLTEESIDIAILPYWMLMGEDSKERVSNLLAPKQIIATHIPPNFSEELANTMRKLITNITLFTELNEDLKYK